MRLELLLVVGDPGISKHMPDVLNQGLEFTALLQASPPELIEAAHLIHRNGERLEGNLLHELQDLIWISVFSNEGKRNMQILFRSVVSLHLLPAEGILDVTYQLLHFLVQLNCYKQSHRHHLFLHGYRSVQIDAHQIVFSEGRFLNCL